jgi:acetyltransferase-like isoleucine patch superfamily enzyme
MTESIDKWTNDLLEEIKSTDDWSKPVQEIQSVGNSRISKGQVVLKSDFLIDGFSEDKERRRLIRYWRWLDNSPFSCDLGIAIPMRYQLAKQLFKVIGERVLIMSNFVFKSGANITLGNDIYIGENVIFDDECPEGGSNCITVGSRCGFSEGVKIIAHFHLPNNYGNEIARPVTIGDDVVVYTGAIILPGTSIGRKSLIYPGVVASGSIASGSRVNIKNESKQKPIKEGTNKIEVSIQRTWEKIYSQKIA